jgi:hypothetical protein
VNNKIRGTNRVAGGFRNSDYFAMKVKPRQAGMQPELYENYAIDEVQIADGPRDRSIGGCCDRLRPARS